MSEQEVRGFVRFEIATNKLFDNCALDQIVVAFHDF
jgi:hypothetical protein